jgi:pilus assembly protein Flp/PilA
MEKIRELSIELYSRVVNREEGQGLVEYALILSLVSIAAIVTLGILGVDVDQVLDTVENALTGDG